LVTLLDEKSLKLRANRLFHLKSKTVGIRLTVGKESSYSLTRFCARLLPNTQIPFRVQVVAFCSKRSIVPRSLP
jgi:hypothetical protein